MSSSVINVQSPTGTTWLFLHWREVALWCFASLFPLYFGVRRWRESSQRGQALFDYTLAETRRKAGDSKSALALYDKILAHACSTDLLWRVHAGRGQALLKRGDASLALVSTNEAISLASVQLAKKRVADAKAALKNGGEAVELDLGPDSDPFLHAPINLAALHYERGLIADALGDSTLAEADFAVAVTLEPDFAFVNGYAARRQFEERLERAGLAVNAPSSSTSGASATASAQPIKRPNATKSEK